MQPKQKSSSFIRRIVKKEVTLFFASPIAYLFLAAFAAITLFVFFWGEAFFSRNIADVRPLFEWMPVLLVFLASTLTMRMWSEERRAGTLEHVLTQPVPLWHFVVGKFLACLLLLVIALLITLPLPITVAILGQLDWGPVIAGYLATVLLGAAYLSIGLFVSARSDNQIVSLISAVALCGVFYLIGTPTITDLFGNRASEWLRLFGTGARFDSITRGVIDLRDLYYYASIIAVFLALNTFVLERERWAVVRKSGHHQVWRAVTALLIANVIGVNLWLGQLNALRIDATAGNQYSISDATRNYLSQLREPLLLRGYFSGKTHPLLSPLVPQLQDLMEEYEVAGNGRVQVEFIDPADNPEMEEEANQQYAIQPVPFQIADRYQSSIVSSYFNVLIKYGDEYETLGFRELIEIKTQGEGNFDVQLRNPEHDLTRAIKKVLNTYQAGGNLFDTVKGDLTFNAYISDNSRLPPELVEFRGTVEKIVNETRNNSDGRLQVNFINPDANNAEVGKQIAEKYGFQPMATNMFSDQYFFFYLTVARGDQAVQIPLEDLSEGSFERNLDAAIKRFASGFTKTVAMITPPAPAPSMPRMGMPDSGGPRFQQLEQFLGAELNVVREDLSDGGVSGEADILLLLAPRELDEKQLFAVDQFLMKGGTVVASTSPYSVNFGERTMTMQRHNSGLSDWLKHHGFDIEENLVLDTQSASFPVPVTRNIGGLNFQEMRMLDYPFLVDVREKGLNQDSAITSSLPQATLAWASPITVDSEKNASREITRLITSSENSWTTSSLQIMPQVDGNGLSRYQPEGEQTERLLGVIGAGRFESYFAGKSSPLLNEPAEESATENAEEESAPRISSVIEHSPESARIILFSSNDFLRDRVIQMVGSVGGTDYLSTLQLAANTIDWSLEDEGLLSIRSRGQFNRTLPPMEQGTQMFWEYLNYLLAAIALALVAVVQIQRKKSREKQYLHQFAS